MGTSGIFISYECPVHMLNPLRIIFLKSAIVLKSGASRSSLQMNSIFRFASISNILEDWTRFGYR
jgi:hypothetical protein